MRTKTLSGIIVAGCAILSACFLLWRHPIWTADGFVYTKMMLKDTGLTDQAATDKTIAFYLQTPIGSDPRFRPFIIDQSRGMFSPEAKPFAVRVLYPALAAPLYPMLGFRSLIFVSAAAYVLTVVLLYLIVATFFCVDWAAAVIAVAFAFIPLIRSLGASALTDMLAALFWLAAFGSMLVYVRKPSFGWLAIFFACCVGLALSRPAIYIPLGAAAFLGLAALVRSDRPRLKIAAALLAAAALAAVGYALMAHVTKTPGLMSHLAWLYDKALHRWFYSSPRVLSASEQHSFGRWYVHEVLLVGVAWLARMVRTVLPAVALVVAAFGILKNRGHFATPVIVGASIFCVVGLFANPVLPEVPRLIEAPLYPLIAMGVGLAVTRASKIQKVYPAG